MSIDDRRLGEANWRPRRVSTAFAAAFGVAVTLGLAEAADVAGTAGVALLSGLCLGGTVWATAVTERRIATVLAGTLATVSGLALPGAFAFAAAGRLGPSASPLAPVVVSAFLFVVAGFLAGFGAPTSIWGVTPAGEAGAASLRLLAVGVVPAAALAVALLAPPLDPVVRFARFGIDLALARGPAGGPVLVDGVAVPRLGGFLAVAALAVFVLQTALDRLPLVELAGSQERPTIEAAVFGVRRWLRWAFVVFGLFSLVAVVLRAALPELYLRVPPAVLAGTVRLTLSTPVRLLLVSAAVVALSAVVASRLVRTAVSDRFRPSVLPAVSLAVGGLLVGVAVGAHPTLEAVALERAGSAGMRRPVAAVFAEFGSLAVALAAVVLGLSVATASLLAVRFAGAVRFLGSTTGIQTVSSAVLLAAIGTALVDVWPPVVIAGVAASLLVWDVGEFADTLGREIGRAGDGLGSELVHAVSAVALAIGSALVGIAALGSLDAVPSAPAPVALLPTVIAAVGTLLLFLVIR